MSGGLPTPEPLGLVRDVTLRDGLQLVSGTLPSSRKVELVRALLAAGFPSLEVGAIVRADRVPQMADTLDLLGELTDPERDRCYVWVPNLKGTQWALDAGARRLQYVFSVSDAHNRENVGRPTQASREQFAVVLQTARDHGATVQLGLATSFTCPFEGVIDPDRVLQLVADPSLSQADSVVLADTTGQARPAQVRDLVQAVDEAFPGPVVFHGHDTWGQGVANSVTALDAGAVAVDGSIGGLGGCPFAPGATGNTPVEDLLYAIRPAWLSPAAFASVVRSGRQALDELAETDNSRAAQAAQRSSARSPWTVGQAGVAQVGTAG